MLCNNQQAAVRCGTLMSRGHVHRPCPAYVVSSCAADAAHAWLAVVIATISGSQMINRSAVHATVKWVAALQDALLVVGTELLDLYLASDGSEYDADDADAAATSSGFGSSGDGSAGDHSTGGTSSGAASSLSPAMSMARAASRTMAGASGIGSGASLGAVSERACHY